jgi:uncharacterized protein (TIGR02996 family)
MIGDQLALLKNIRANPDDDLARLVYADWVEERGDKPMGDLIRVHIEREHAEPGSARYFDLISHAGMLLAQNRDRWTADLRERFCVTGVEFVRGIPEEVELPLSAFAGVAEKLFSTLPIRHVILTGVSELSVLRRLMLPPEVMRSAAAEGVSREDYWRRRDGWTVSPVQRALTLLDPAPLVMEPGLRIGRWRILCPAVWSGPDLATEAELFQQFVADPDGATDFGERRLAVRQFSRPEEFAAWCPVPNPQAGPHWIELEDGKLVSHRRGLELPDLYPDEVDDEEYDADWE